MSGSLLAKETTRRTRARSATGGARRCATPVLSGIKLHDLRHFYASGLIAAGCDVVTVQRSLGHSKATTTLNTYAHLWPTAEDRTRTAAESIMTQSMGLPADSVRTGSP
jgi:integrase